MRAIRRTNNNAALREDGKGRQAVALARSVGQAGRQQDQGVDALIDPEIGEWLESQDDLRLITYRDL